MKKNVLLIFVMAILLVGCSKEDPEPDPTACFTISSTLIDVNEVILTSNCSSNAFSYLWNDGDGNQSTLTEPSIHYPEPGDYIITLKAYSESGDKEDVAQESVKVIQMTGKVTFWMSGTPSYYITTVTIGQLSDQITLSYSNGISGCNVNGCANFTLPTGTYPYYATDGVVEWTGGSVTILANDCVRVKLQ